MATKVPFKQRQVVNYKTRTNSGTATVQKVRETARGAWIEVKTADGGRLTLRPGCLTAA